MRLKVVLPVIFGGMVLLATPAKAEDWASIQQRINLAVQSGSISPTQSWWLQQQGEAINKRRQPGMSYGQQRAVDSDLDRVNGLFQTELRKGNSDKIDPTGTAYKNSAANGFAPLAGGGFMGGFVPPASVTPMNTVQGAATDPWLDLQARINNAVQSAQISPTQSWWLQMQGEQIKKRRAELIAAGRFNGLQQRAVDSDYNHINSLFQTELRKGNSNNFDPDGTAYKNSANAGYAPLASTPVFSKHYVAPNLTAALSSDLTALMSQIQAAAGTGKISTYQSSWLQGKCVELQSRQQSWMTQNGGHLNRDQRKTLAGDLDDLQGLYKNELRKGNSNTWDPTGSRYKTAQFDDGPGNGHGWGHDPDHHKKNWKHNH